MPNRHALGVSQKVGQHGYRCQHLHGMSEIVMRNPERGKAAPSRHPHLLAHIFERRSNVDARWKLRADVKSDFLHGHHLSRSFVRSPRPMGRFH